MTAKDARKGQALPLVTVSLVVIIGIVALAVDLGLLYYYRTSAQAAADAAALAAATAAKIDNITCGAGIVCNVANDAACPGAAPDYLYQGCLYATQNGFTAGGHGGRQDVKVRSGKNSSPAGVPGVGNVEYWASITVSESYPSLFSAILGSGGSTVRARATAVVFGGGAASSCLYVLNRTAQGAFLADNNAQVWLNNCGAYVNSSAPAAAHPWEAAQAALGVLGSANVFAIGASLQVVGGASTDNSGSKACPAVSGNPPTCNGTPTSGVTPGADPMASIPAPTIDSTCKDGNYNRFGTFDVYPGTYCNGFTTGNNATIRLHPGDYVIKGGAISFNYATVIQQTQTTGDGVTFYLTGSDPTVQIANGVTLNLWAPQSGARAGMLFMQDRTVTGSSITSHFAGGANSRLAGTLYFPNTKIDISNGTNTNTFGTVVADTIRFRGGAKYVMDGSLSGGAGSTSRIVALVD